MNLLGKSLSFMLKNASKGVEKMKNEDIEKKRKEYLEIVEELSLLEKELYELELRVNDLRLRQAEARWEFWKALDKKNKKG